MMKLEAPVAPAGAVAALRERLRLDDGIDEGMAAALMVEAVVEAEAMTGQVLLVRAGSETLGADGCWRRLNAWPVVAVTGAAGLNPDGTTTPLAPEGWAADLALDGSALVRVAVGGRVRVSLTAGAFADWGEVPADLRGAIVALAMHRHAGGEDVPRSVATRLTAFRRRRLA